VSCLACDLLEGRLEVPGGSIYNSGRWVVEHCIGPLGVGTLIVKPRRHVVHVSDLEADEAAELGPLLQRTTSVITSLADPDQVYVCLWSHAGGPSGDMPGHIHFVLQPVSRELRLTHGGGPSLQGAMFNENVTPPLGEVEGFAERARQLFG
jgi:ATP adenylyltransferase